MNSQTQSKLFLVQIRIKELQPGVHFYALLRNIQNFLAGGCIPYYKVAGEPRIITVIDVKETLHMERTMYGLSLLGVFDVECTPLFKENANLAPSLHPNNTENQLYWLEFTLEFPGSGTFRTNWWRNAAKSFRTVMGTKIDLFKVLAGRKLHAFICCPADGVEQLSTALEQTEPSINIKIHALQTLDDYITYVTNKCKDIKVDTESFKLSRW